MRLWMMNALSVLGAELKTFLSIFINRAKQLIAFSHILSEIANQRVYPFSKI
jgi:hypothetical protein